ncbi:laccase-1 [Andrographis paniculata]|uniref:laccase-1 n=1 Tax=Andrographis paniculata TaxID=175694 RepID=UPI0021E704AF|nr:laccase-1 [Andrographis paniculata]
MEDCCCGCGCGCRQTATVLLRILFSFAATPAALALVLFLHLHLHLLLMLPPAAFADSSTTKTFRFNIERTNITRLCHTKAVVTVNGEFPGPTIAVREGDAVRVVVTNTLSTNTTIHWHGVRQMRSGWADGPAYITQCPIGAGETYTYTFTVVGQRGTLWWHAHYAWHRASVYGAFLIQPSSPVIYKYDVDAPPIILGEWWNADVDLVESQMMLYGGGPNTSDAYTINGLPGPLYPCSTSPDHTFVQTVQPGGKTYLLRLINAALNDELFFAVADHNLTVVEVDAAYTKPFTTPAVMLAPGQTTNVLLVTAAARYSSTFVIAARPYLTGTSPFDNSTTIGFLKYLNTNDNDDDDDLIPPLPPPPHNNYDYYTLPPNLPALKDTPFATSFSDSLRSLGSADSPCSVPKEIDRRVVTTIGLNLQDCPANHTCRGRLGKRFHASMNNQSFLRPTTTSILSSHYYNNRGLNLSSDFPENPPHVFNYTGVDPMAENMNTAFGARLLRVAFGTRLEVVLQGTNFLNSENHPIHFHGHNFFVVGTGFGNYDVRRDPGNYNLVDPPERNTVAVPTGGWAAIRLTADNPGVWFIHCHLEAHTSWGLAVAMIVEDGKEPWERLPPPPSDLPTC